jgi:hypothetical protein
MIEELSITSEAKRLLDEEARELAAELEQEAIAEALRNRGRPVEVTASDVRRARIRFTKRDRPLLPMTDLLLRFYLFGGLMLFVGGFLYPLVRPFILEANPEARASFLVSLAGLAAATVGFVGRFFLKWREELRARHKYEEYERQRHEAKQL